MFRYASPAVQQAVVNRIVESLKQKEKKMAVTDEQYEEMTAELKDGVEKLVKTAIKALEDNKYSGLEMIRTTQVGGELAMTIYYMVSELDTAEERHGFLSFLERAHFQV